MYTSLERPPAIKSKSLWISWFFISGVDCIPSVPIQRVQKYEELHCAALYKGIVSEQSNLVKTNFREPAKLVLIIGSCSYQDIVIHVQYYSKPNGAIQETKFVLSRNLS